jgi:hypothetical protein
MGLMLVDQTEQAHDKFWTSHTVSFGLPYFSISLAINVILTSMIVIRLVLHSRNIRNAMGTQDGASGVYKAIITVLVESSALYTVSFLLFIGPWSSTSYVEYIFFPPLAQVQVRAVSSFSFRTSISCHCFLITATNRSSLRSSSLYELPIGEH